MKITALFISDFQKGTQISEKLIAIDFQVKFVEKIDDISDKYAFIIIDLDDKNFGNKNFVKDVKSKSNIFIIGYMNSLKKHSVDSFKKNGCDLILSGSSLLKNIESLTHEIYNKSSQP